jgi:hypothetical protein
LCKYIAPRPDFLATMTAHESELMKQLGAFLNDLSEFIPILAQSAASSENRSVRRAPYPLWPALTRGFVMIALILRSIHFRRYDCWCLNASPPDAHLNDRNCSVCLLGNSCFVPLTEQAF